MPSIYQKRGDGVDVLPFTTFCSWISFWKEKDCFHFSFSREEVGLGFWGMHHTGKAARIRDELDVPVSILEHHGARKRKREISSCQLRLSTCVLYFRAREFA